MKRSLTVLALLIVALAAGAGWYVYSKQPSRQGMVELQHLQGSVTVRYDERGIPHIRAENETDLYRALGYVHAQDRLFQMEVLRRLARGELAEVLGPKLLDTDKLMRSLRIRERADTYLANMDKQSPAFIAMQAYLDGINQYQDSHPKPAEFDVLGIPKRPFTALDTISITGYMAYSFAAAFRTEPLLTYVRDQLGANYLNVFDLDWQPKGVLAKNRSGALPPLASTDWKDLNALARLSEQALADNGLPQFEGSNAWAVSGSRTKSGKPLLAGDPHIRFSAPSVWYEAQLSAPGFELYGHYQALMPFASLGMNRDFGWSITMFQNDDLDLIAEKVNPDNPNQVWYRGKWVDMVTSEQQIAVKGQAPVTLVLRQSPHGPIVNDALGSGVVAARPKYRESTVLACQRCGHRFAIVNHPALDFCFHGVFHPTGRESGTRLHRLGQLPARVADRHGDSRVLQPGRSWSATQSPAQRQNHQVGSGRQPEAATGHHHRLRPPAVGAVVAGIA